MIQIICLFVPPCCTVLMMNLPKNLELSPRPQEAALICALKRQRVSHWHMQRLENLTCSEFLIFMNISSKTPEFSPLIFLSTLLSSSLNLTRKPNRNSCFLLPQRSQAIFFLCNSLLQKQYFLRYFSFRKQCCIKAILLIEHFVSY